MEEGSPILTSPPDIVPDYDETVPTPTEADAMSPTHLLAPTRFNPTVDDTSEEELRPAWLIPSQAAAGASHDGKFSQPDLKPACVLFLAEIINVVTDK